MIGVALALTLASTVPPATAATEPPVRPALVLVLSGGGARGAAHIGVLRVLDELHVKPDLVVGTSMGSIVGGLYSAGWTPAEIEDVLREIDWTKTFVDKPARSERSFRRKRDDVDFLVQAKMRLRGLKPYLPPSIVGGQNLDLLLRSIERRSIPATDFDDLAVPYRAVATDIELGQVVVLDSGSLAEAMRASMAAPGIFAPVEWDGRKLVDGGIVANLPVGIALGLGARRIVAVDITSDLEQDASKFQSLFGVIGQTNAMLTVLNRREDVARLRPGDLLIAPDLGTIGFIDFERTVEAVGIGEAAARAMIDELRPLAVDDATWEAFRARRASRPLEPPRIDAVRIENTSRVRDGIVASRLDVPVGQTLDEAVLAKDVTELRGLEYFGLIRGDVRPLEPRGNELVVRAPSPPYGRGSLQFGLSLHDDSSANSTYTFAIRHLMLALNRRGGEWANVLQSGNTEVLSSEFYQPLDDGMRWFVSPTIEYRKETRDAWLDGERVAEVDLRRSGAHVDAGRVLGNWGELRVGAFFSEVDVHTTVGLPSFPDESGRDCGLAFQFRLDTADSIQFPRHGSGMLLGYAETSETLGSELDYRRALLIAGKAWSFGRTTLFPSLDGGVNFEDDPALPARFGLGGFVRLSGLGRDELIGERYGMARVLLYRELAKIDLGALSQRIYAGASIEAGNAWDEGDEVTWPSLRYGGSLFVGADTVAGPVYLGWGSTEPDRGRWFFILGERF